MSTKLIDVLDAIDHRGREVVEGEMGLWVRVSEWGLVREALRHSPTEALRPEHIGLRWAAGRQRDADAKSVYQIATYTDSEFKELGCRTMQQAVEFAADMASKNSLVTDGRSGDVQP